MYKVEMINLPVGRWPLGTDHSLLVSSALD